MTSLREEIAAFDQMRDVLEAQHKGKWVVFHKGAFVAAFPDFEAAATNAVERFNEGSYLIRRVGAPPIQLPGGMIFTPAQVLG